MTWSHPTFLWIVSLLAPSCDFVKIRTNLAFWNKTSFGRNIFIHGRYVSYLMLLLIYDHKIQDCTTLSQGVAIKLLRLLCGGRDVIVSAHKVCPITRKLKSSLCTVRSDADMSPLCAVTTPPLYKPHPLRWGTSTRYSCIHGLRL